MNNRLAINTFTSATFTFNALVHLYYGNTYASGLNAGAALVCTGNLVREYGLWNSVDAVKSAAKWGLSLFHHQHHDVNALLEESRKIEQSHNENENKKYPELEDVVTNPMRHKL